MDDLVHQQAHHPQPLPSPSTPTNNNVLAPSWRGIVMTTYDALRVIEACLNGQLMHTARRPHDRERDSLIQSGNVFVYEESSSGIKRWTDGQNWSPSRILGNFLIYRELDKNFPPGDKKRAIKRKRDGKPELSNGNSNMNASPGSINDERQRALLGSLIDSYPFKEGGLIKKTISIKWQGVMHHLVSYYSLEDASAGNLPTPSQDPKLLSIRPRHELLGQQDFRVPVEQEDPRIMDERALMLGMGYAPQSGLERTMSLPQMPMMQPYGAQHHFHMPMHMQQPMSSSLQLGGHFGHSQSGFVPWDHRPRAPSINLPTYSPNPSLPHMMDSGSKRRRSEAYDSANGGTDDLFSPGGMTHADVPRTSHHYYQPASSSYAMPSLPSTSMGSDSPVDYKPSVTSMGPPSHVSAISDPPITTMDFAAPSVTTMAPPSLSGTSIDGSHRDSHYFSPPNFASWSSTHDSNSYLSTSGRSMNGGWPHASQPGTHR
ncbi:Global transcription regulator sge1 [Diaporthe australafricana]|uniref:Global transcription regulator sge1 n=1 Tax=Diaporthe australafricana TaxID=127596 RepID=A0ABR3WDH5_9PEZI